MTCTSLTMAYHSVYTYLLGIGILSINRMVNLQDVLDLKVSSSVAKVT